MKVDIAKKLEQAIKNDTGQREIMDYLLDNLTTREMASCLAELIEKELTKPVPSPVIRISEEDFYNHFRIIGFRSDGQRETRGGRYANKE